MKKQITFLVICTMAFVMISCVTTSQNVEESGAARAQKTIILEDQGTAYGITQPEWVAYELGGTRSKVKELYVGQQPIIVKAEGENLDTLIMRSNTTAVGAEVARLVSTAVVQNAVDKASSIGATVNEAAYSNSVHQAARATFRGLMKEGEWWLLRQTHDGKEEYVYLVLYLMDERLFNEQVLKIVEDTSSDLHNPELEDAVKKSVGDAMELFDTIQDSESAGIATSAESAASATL